MKRLVMGMFLGGFVLSMNTAVFADAKIAQRKENQQQRIGNGVKSGQLTARETGHLEHQEANLNKQIRNDRKANGGNLTDNEKRQVNREQNGLSREIYNDKHNGATQH